MAKQKYGYKNASLMGNYRQFWDSKFLIMVSLHALPPLG